MRCNPRGLLLRTTAPERGVGLSPGAAALDVCRRYACQRRDGAARAQGPRAPGLCRAVANRGGCSQVSRTTAGEAHTRSWTLLTESTPQYQGQRSPRPPCRSAWSVTGRPRGCQLVVVRGFPGAPVLHYVTRVDVHSVERHNFQDCQHDAKTFLVALSRWQEPWSTPWLCPMAPSPGCPSRREE